MADEQRMDRAGWRQIRFFLVHAREDNAQVRKLTLARVADPYAAPRLTLGAVQG